MFTHMWPFIFVAVSSVILSHVTIFESLSHWFCNMASPHLVDLKTSFSSFSHLLDARLLRALADMGFARPTLVQAKAIPLALEGRDILARARTGSGKTAAYCVPVVQKILSAKSVRTTCLVVGDFGVHAVAGFR
jgi:superfamily II DNA/RNA helicase